MSEQKYYVRLNRVVYIKPENIIFDGFVWLDEDWDFVNEEIRFPFTKSELAEIMDGAFYHISSEKCDYCRYSGGDTCGDDNCEEWINPLIELVPVEGSE